MDIDHLDNRMMMRRKKNDDMDGTGIERLEREEEGEGIPMDRLKVD